MKVDECKEIFELFPNENHKPPSVGIINSNVNSSVIDFIPLSISYKCSICMNKEYLNARMI